jgi:RsiW-degrading membrane proteinase PrsW (M82 family)
MYLDHFLHIFAALLPAIVILVYIYKQDKFPEPKKIVFKTFLFGCATVLDIDLLIPVFDHFSEENFKGNTYYFFDSFIRAGFLEEFFKSVVIIFFCTRKSVFDEPMDGIVYGVAASLGFAAYENIDYVRYFAEKTSILDISLIRTFSAVPMHALCGVMMGFLISLSIFSKKNNYLFLVLSILIPVGMHGLYNFSLSSDLISHEIANVILFLSFLGAIYLFREMKHKQSEGRMFHQKYYTITVNNFIQATTTVLIFYLILNFIVNMNF